jgi:hypothetical protein
MHTFNFLNRKMKMTAKLIINHCYGRLQGFDESTWTQEGGSGRRLHNEELHNLYPSPNIVKVMKLRRMRWVQHVACTI